MEIKEFEKYSKVKCNTQPHDPNWGGGGGEFSESKELRDQFTLVRKNTEFKKKEVRIARIFLEHLILESK